MNKFCSRLNDPVFSKHEKKKTFTNPKIIRIGLDSSKHIKWWVQVKGVPDKHIKWWVEVKGQPDTHMKMMGWGEGGT